MADEHTIPERRELTTNERGLLEWLLENGSPEASAFTAQLTEVKVAAIAPVVVRVLTWPSVERIRAPSVRLLFCVMQRDILLKGFR